MSYSRKMHPLVLISAVSISVSGCSTLTNPEDLQTPTVISCIYLPTPISFTEKVYGYTWETRLEKGPYLSEKEGSDGVYFRGPPGGLSHVRADLKDKPMHPATHGISDGGFLLPHNPKSPPRLYSYFSASNAEIKSIPDNISCSTVAYVSDPSNLNLSIVYTAVEGATGVVLGRAAAPGSSVSYGQAALGGAIAGGLIAAVINSEVGNISLWDDLKDTAFIEQLNTARSNVVLLENPGLQAPLAE